jgi:hypothetical protein
MAWNVRLGASSPLAHLQSDRLHAKFYPILAGRLFFNAPEPSICRPLSSRRLSRRVVCDQGNNLSHPSGRIAHSRRSPPAFPCVRERGSARQSNSAMDSALRVLARPPARLPFGNRRNRRRNFFGPHPPFGKMGKSQRNRSTRGLLHLHEQLRRNPWPNAKNRMEKRGFRVLLDAPRGRSFGRIGRLKMWHHHPATSANPPNHRSHRPFRRLQSVGETTRRVEGFLTPGFVAGLYQKQLAFRFLERSTGVSPVCIGVLFGFDKSKQMDQSPHGRDGHAPFFCNAKSNFKKTLVLLPPPRASFAVFHWGASFRKSPACDSLPATRHSARSALPISHFQFDFCLQSLLFEMMSCDYR